MKSSFKKLRNLALQKHSNAKEEEEATIIEHTGPVEEPPEVQEGMQVVEEMHTQLDGLLSIGHMISSAAYDFSRSFQEMASHMVETLTQIHTNDCENGNIFDMLGKVQFEISKILDAYCARVAQTIISPTESLMTELEHVKDMKRLCDEKRQSYNDLCIQEWPNNNKKGKGKNGGKEDAIDRKVSTAKGELNDLTNRLGCRLQSLKQGRPLSLTTQAVRFHAAQVDLFRKGLDFLEAIEPSMEQLSRRQNIDRLMSERDVGVYGTRDDRDEIESFESSPFSSQANEMDVEKSKVVASKLGLIPSDLKNLKNELDLEKPPTQKATYVLPIPLREDGDRTNSVVAETTGDYTWSYTGGDGKLQRPPPKRGRQFNEASSITNKESHTSPDLHGVVYSSPFLAKPIGTPATLHRIDPLYKSGPICSSPATITPPQVSPRRSPTVSPARRLPAPQITELHKLPAPPSIQSANAPSLQRRVSLIAYSAPLGKKNDSEISPRQGVLLPPTNVIMRSLSIPSPSSRSTRQCQPTLEAQAQPVFGFELPSPALSPMLSPTRRRRGDPSQASPLSNPWQKAC